MSIWQRRTPKSINEWLRANADGMRIKKVEAGIYLLYNRFVKDVNDRIICLGSLGDCRVAAMGVVKRCEQRMA